MWGQGFIVTVLLTQFRIIPTRVGTRQLMREHYDLVEDHPHACGDKDSAILFYNPFVGSSPRVWGQEKQKVPRETVLGIIPTRVGTRQSK